MPHDRDNEFFSSDLLDRLGLPDILKSMPKRSSEGTATGPEPKTPEEWRDQLRRAQRTILDQDEKLRRYEKHPIPYACVLSLREATEASPASAVVIYDGRIYEVPLPASVTVERGDSVRVSRETSQIIDIVDVPLPGKICVVQNAEKNTLCEVDLAGTPQVVLSGKYAGNLEAGDRVIVDATGSIIIGKIGRTEERFQFSGTTNVSWDDVGGLETAKRQLIEGIELPYKYPGLYTFYNKGQTKGFLLYGPPGCGKTYIIKAVATSLIKTHGGKGAETALIVINGPEILDKFVGNAEATIRQLFYLAKKHHAKYGYPAIIVIDEAESLLKKRGSGISSDIENTIVPMFLAQMDGVASSNVIVMLATNRPDMLDPAVVRDGRVDRKIKIERPKQDAARQIFRLNFKKTRLAEGLGIDDMIAHATTELYSKARALYRIRLAGILDEAHPEKDVPDEFRDMLLGDIASGAMIAGIVDKAISLALQRDIETGNTSGTGVTKEDVTKTITDLMQENIDMSLDAELREFGQDLYDRVVRQVQKLRQATA